MHITVKAKNLHPQKGDANIDIEIPSKCPRCGIAYGKRPESSFVFQLPASCPPAGTVCVCFSFGNLKQ